MTHLYLAECSNHYKIGATCNVEKRLKFFQEQYRHKKDLNGCYSIGSWKLVNSIRLDYCSSYSKLTNKLCLKPEKVLLSVLEPYATNNRIRRPVERFYKCKEVYEIFHLFHLFLDYSEIVKQINFALEEGIAVFSNRHNWQYIFDQIQMWNDIEYFFPAANLFNFSELVEKMKLPKDSMPLVEVVRTKSYCPCYFVCSKGKIKTSW